MSRKMVILLVVSCVLCVMGHGLCVAQDEEIDAEQKAEEIHERASSDVIFIHDELRALYYQNVQIIQLLKDMKDLLNKQLEKSEEE